MLRLAQQQNTSTRACWISLHHAPFNETSDQSAHTSLWEKRSLLDRSITTAMLLYAATSTDSVDHLRQALEVRLRSVTLLVLRRRKATSASPIGLTFQAISMRVYWRHALSTAGCRNS